MLCITKAFFIEQFQINVAGYSHILGAFCDHIWSFKTGFLADITVTFFVITDYGNQIIVLKFLSTLLLARNYMNVLVKALESARVKLVLTLADRKRLKSSLWKETCAASRQRPRRLKKILSLDKTCKSGVGSRLAEICAGGLWGEGEPGHPGKG